MFETKIIESHNKPSPNQQVPAQILRIGVSTAGSSLFLADGQDNVCFDAQGLFIHDASKKQVFPRMNRNQSMAVVLNLDEKSTNAHTISLFCDGKRVCQPQPLPEHLKGKTLYPTICFKNVTLDVNFGPTAMQKLPFVCRPMQEAAASDVEVIEAHANKDGKCEVVFPVGMPDQGMFDWASQFLEKNPHFTELSDRKLIEWAAKSGIPRHGGYEARTSLDKPEMNFKIANMDDMSMQAILSAAAGAVPRNYLVMELKSNLIKDERKAAIERFYRPEFKKIATVVVGEQPHEYQEYIRGLVLRKKEARVASEKKKKQALAAQQKLTQQRQKKLEAAKKAMAAKKAGLEPEPEEEEKEEEDADMAEDDAAVELTEEEQEMKVRKLPYADLTPLTLARYFTDFSLPSSEEGFDSIRYAWGPADKAESQLKEWVTVQKRSQRVESLQPSEWFREQHKTWQTSFMGWKKQQIEWSDPAKKKALLAKKLEADEKEPEEIDFEDLDVFAVENVSDIGSGEGLFGRFGFEDWALLSLRYEYDLLLRAFCKDLDDPERPTFHESHFLFYYTKYFRKQLNLKAYGVDSVVELLKFVKDTAKVSEEGLLENELGQETPLANFVKLTEEHRRDRQRRCDAGDESAELDFNKALLAPQQPAAGAGTVLKLGVNAGGPRPAVPGASAGMIAQGNNIAAMRAAMVAQAQQGQQAQQAQQGQRVVVPGGMRPQMAVPAGVRPQVARPQYASPGVRNVVGPGGIRSVATGGLQTAGLQGAAGGQAWAAAGVKRQLLGAQPNMVAAKQPRPNVVTPGVRPNVLNFNNRM